LAVAAVNSPTSSLKAYEDLARYLGDHLGIGSKVVGSKTYAEINSLVRSGDAAVAVVCSGAYVFGNAEFGMELLASPVIGGQQLYQSYLIVPASSAAEKLTDLQGKTFAFTDPLSNSGRLVPLYELSRIGKTPETFFSKYIFTYSHENSIKAVAHALVDAAAVDSLIYDHALATGQAYASKTKVIWRSPQFAINPLVVSPRLDPARKAALKALLLNIDRDPAGAEILRELGVDRFKEADDASYEPVRIMANAVGGGVVP
jgi:phosphonate transport system substrate-binding protein